MSRCFCCAEVRHALPHGGGKVCGLRRALRLPGSRARPAAPSVACSWIAAIPVARARMVAAVMNFIVPVWVRR